MPTFITNQIIENMHLPTSRIGILGLSFKPNSDDVRDSPSAKIINQLQSLGYNNILAYDPVANEEFSKHYKFNNMANSIDQLFINSDLVVLLTAWPEFKNINNEFKKKILDFRYYL
jgi:UDPglucose 6-dehydrogenase